jgi:hypothetical protein
MQMEQINIILRVVQKRKAKNIEKQIKQKSALKQLIHSDKQDLISNLKTLILIHADNVL